MFILIDPCRFLSAVEIKMRIAAVTDHLHDDDQVRLPGEGAYYKSVTAQKSGIEIQDYVLQSLAKLAVELAVEIPEKISRLATTSTKGNFKSW
jgi:LDH2 family malate/lactate/ureidoglycolate dehydrogenase